MATRRSDATCSPFGGWMVATMPPQTHASTIEGKSFTNKIATIPRLNHKEPINSATKSQRSNVFTIWAIDVCNNIVTHHMSTTFGQWPPTRPQRFLIPSTIPKTFTFHPGNFEFATRPSQTNASTTKNLNFFNNVAKAPRFHRRRLRLFGHDTVTHPSVHPKEPQFTQHDHNHSGLPP